MPASPRWAEIANRAGSRAARRALADLLLRARRGELARVSLAITTPTRLSRLVARQCGRRRSPAKRVLGSPVSMQAFREGRPSRAQCRCVITAIGIAALLSPWPSVRSDIPVAGGESPFLAAILFAFSQAPQAWEREKPGPSGRGSPASDLFNCRRPPREARVVAQLVAVLEAIDYPRGKLDIKLVIETRTTGRRASAPSAAPFADLRNSSCA